MSGTTLRMLISFGGFLAIFWGAQHVAKLETERALEERKLGAGDLPKIFHTDKVRGPLASEITLVSTVSSANAKVLVLQASVSTVKDVKDVKLRWVLPAGMTLVSGSLETTIAEVTVDNPVHTQITVEQKGLSNEQIHFVAASEQPGLRFSAVSQFNTTDETYLKEQKQLVIKALENTPKPKRAHILH